MADQLLKDRQDAPIWNAIDASNFKQALKLVDKRLAKKRSDYLEALKVYIRSRSPLLAEKEAVLLHLDELAEKKKAIADLETVELYDEAFGEIFPEPQESWDRTIGELRWLCVKSQPKNEDLSLKCFQACLGKGDMEHAKQISNSLEKTFSSNHSYVFWNIASMFLYSISEKYPEKQRKLWGSLAFAQIGKLATATKQATDPKKLPSRSIKTPQELLLLHRITEALGKPEQRLEYLNDPTLGPESAVAKAWQELFETTKSLLKRARTKDESGQLSESGMSDWIVWEAFIRSAVELRNLEPKDVVIAEVKAHLDPTCEIDKSWKRNASLALVKITFVSSSPFQGQPHDRIPVIIKYLQKYGSASTAYNDLRPFVEQLNVEDRKRLLELILKDAIFEGLKEDKDFKTANRITQLVNTYKLRYLLTSSLPEYEIRESAAYKSNHKNSGEQYSTSSLRQLAQDAAKLYLAAVDGGRAAWDLLPTDTHPADDLYEAHSLPIAPNPESLEVPFSDTNDYETFPNFECTQGPRFEELCRIVPASSDYRTRINLAAEKLTQLLQPIPDDKGGKTASQAALQSFLGSTSEKFPKSSSRNLLTQPEELSRQSYNAMDLIIQYVCDRERWSDQKFQEQLDSHNKELCESLEEQRSFVGNIKAPVPALSSTLHALYTGYESGKTASIFSAYLSSKGKDIPESQAEANKKIAEAAQRLLQTVAEKAAAIKKGLDEGGLIDKMLDSVLQGPDGADASVLGKLRDSVDESHLELWAGDVVESWRDSVAGLSYLKA
ncbi:hypothetical protein LAWI1_G001112 [Lachnellula willkommii]|uniref:N-terminal acetyltransferase B complex subunit n=1 Tax=Lachnellula willkommii TaxID=215461 RepID=A0A559MEN7_9HELO|nr:hypothetical protein LAWI1_G001112 [Lachnellula willkommii]